MFNNIMTAGRDAQRESRSGDMGEQVRLGVAVYLGRFVGWSVRKVFSYAVAIAWIFAVVMTWQTSAFLGVMFLAAAVGLIVAGFWYPFAWHFAPFVGDWRRNRARKVQRLSEQNGLMLLERSGLLNERMMRDRRALPSVRLEEDDERAVFYLERGIAGVSPERLANTLDDFKWDFGAERTSRVFEQDGGLVFTFWKVDPLDEVIQLDDVPAIDLEDMSVPCAVDEFGETVSLTFKDNSGVVFGGTPGSGKTAGMTSFLLPLALADDVNFRVIDAKGGGDWTAYEDAATTFLEGSDSDAEFQALRDFLLEQQARMVERKQMGLGNFWNLSLDERRERGLKFELLVVDETQELFEQAGKSRERRALMSEIQDILQRLVKQGRSLGFMTVFATQKPTTDAMPSAIRDNCGIRVALRVMNSQAEASILGAVPDDTTVRASAIPASRQGGAVLQDESDGSYKYVRFFYIPAGVQERLLQTNIKEVEDDE